MTADSMNLLVTGHHVFEEEGLYGVSVSVSDPAGNSSTGGLEVPVSDADLQAWGQPFTAVVGAPFSGTVANLSDANPYAPATDFSATIDWGDGSTSAGTVTDDGSGNGGFTIAGDHTYASPGTYTVTTTIDDDGGATATATSTATVEAAWTVTGGTRTDDPQNAFLTSIGTASVDLNQGAVRVSQALDFDLSPGTSVGGDPALIYNSATVSVRPVVQLQVQTDPSGPAPTQAEVVLTWDGVTQNAVTFALGAAQPGQALTLAVQVDNAVAQSGHYDWSATLTFTFSDQSTTQASASGTADVVVRDSSPYGAGWGIDGIAQLVATAGGVLWVTGAGDSRYFTDNGDGTFSSPAEDFGTLVQNADGTYTYTATDQTTSNFNAAGYLTSVVDTHGLARTYGYDAQDRLNQVQAIDGGLTTLAYDPNSGLLSSITEPGNRVLQFAHDGSGNLSGLIDAAGFGRTLGYDTEHHLTSDQWAPLSVAFGYDAGSGLLTQVDQGLGSVWTVNAAAAQGLNTAVAGPVWATLSDAVPHTTQVLLDERGRLLEQIEANGATENYFRDAAGQVDVAVDALSQPTFYTYAYGAYDPSVGGGDGDLVRVDNPDGSSTEYAYDPTFHHVIEETTSIASGETGLTVNTYDASTGDLLTQTTAAGTAEAATTTNVWVNGLLSTSTDADGNVTEYFYDSNRRQSGVDVHEGNASQPVVSSESDTYDASGNPATVSNADGVTVTVNDANNRLVSESVYAADGVTLVRSDSSGYLADGQVSSTRDGDGNVTQTTYDQVGRVSVTTTSSARGVLALGRSYAYDVAGNVTRQTEGDGSYTDRTYNAVGDVLTETARNADGTLASTSSDGENLDGEVTQVTDGDGNTTVTTYDRMGQELTVSVYDGQGKRVRYTANTYDEAGNLVAVRDGDGNRTLYTYDLDQRVTHEEVRDAGNHLVSQSDKAYDKDGNLVWERDGDGNVTLSVFDADGQMTQQSTWSAAGTLVDQQGSTFDTAGEQTSQTDGVGNVTREVSNADGQVTHREVRSAADVLISQEDFTYDLSGQLLTARDGDGNVTTYTRNAAGQVTHQETRSASNALVSKQDFTYDAAGKETSQIDGDGNITTEVTNADGNVTHREVRSAVYDVLISQEDFTYDPAGRLLTARDGDNNVTTYTRNADGQVTHQETRSASNVLVSKQDFTYDAAGNETSQIDGDGNITTEVTNADGNVTHRDVRSAVYGTLISQEDFTYDPAGRLLTARDGDGNLTTYTRNADGQVTHQETRSASNALVSKQDFTYDTAGDETSQIDGDGNVTTEVTNADGNVTHREVRDVYDTLISQEDFTYDTAGRLLTARDGDGNLTTYTRNADGQVTHQETRSASNALVSKQDFTYDTAGDETSQIDGDGNVTTEVTNADGNVTHREVRDVYDTLISQEDFTYDTAGRLLTARDGDNNITTYTRNADGQVTHQETRSATNALVSKQDFTYDTAGNETSQIDGDGNVTTEVTNADGNVMHREVRDVYDTLISQEDFTYDPAGRLLTARDGDNNITTYTRNADGQVTHQETRSATNALVSQQDFTYDTAGNETSQIDGDGNVTTEVTNADGNVTHREVRSAVYDVLISQEDFTYDPAGRLLTARDGDNNVTTYTRNADGQVTHQETRSATNALVSKQDFTYDTAGNETSQIDGDGNITTEVTNADGNVTHREVRSAVYDVLISQEDFTYDTAGRLLTARDGDGNLTTYTRNADGQVTHQETRSASNALVSQQDFTYDAAGDETSQIDGDGNVTTEVTNADGNVTHRDVRDASGTLVRSDDFTYDKAGYLASQTDGDGTVTTFTRNADGQVTHQETRDAAGNLVAQTDSAYDDAGNLVSVTDGVGRQTRTTYDAAGNKTSETQGFGTPRAATTTYAYDEDGNLLEVTDPVGNHTFFSYEDGLKVSMTDPQGHTATYAYDDAGRLISTTDRDGRRIDYGYDADGNKISEKWYDASGTLVETLSWTYDADGNVLTAFSSAGTYAFRYDALGRVVHVDEPFGLSLDFAYDQAGNRVLVVDSLGGSVASTYDGNQLVSRVFSQSGQPTLRIDFTYDLAGNVTSQIRYSDAAGTTVVASSAFTYDGGRLTALQDENASGTSLAAYSFSYDTAGQLTAKTDHGISSTYSYDALGQLTGDGSASYSFDTNGNRTMTGYVTGPGNQLLSDGTWNYAYDTEGNVTSKTNISTGEVWTYAYDNRNQLVLAEHKASATAAVDLRVSFEYDVFGNLIEKDVDADGDGPGAAVVTRYALDGWKTGPQAESATGNAAWDVWADLNGDGTLQTHYLRGDAIDELFARVGSDGSAFWTLTDNQGSVCDVINQSGAIKDSLRFDDFGNIAAETEAAYRGSYGWTGRVWVAEVGLQYNRARWYDPTDGRWLSQDPEGFDAGDVDLYRADRNSPTNATDPSGLQASDNWYALPPSVKAYYWGAYYGRLEQWAQTQAQNHDNLARWHRFWASETFWQKFRMENVRNSAWHEQMAQLEADFRKKAKEEQQRSADFAAQAEKAGTAAWYYNQLVPQLRAQEEKQQREWMQAQQRSVSQPTQSRPGNSLATVVGTQEWLYAQMHKDAGNSEATYAGKRETVLGARDVYHGFLRDGQTTVYVDFPAHVMKVVKELALLYVEGKGIEVLLTTGVKVGGVTYRYLRNKRQLVKIVKGGKAVALEKREVEALATELRVINQRTCFVAGTPLLTPDGAKAIEDFRPGDLILSRPENDVEAPIKAMVVEEVFIRVALVFSLHVGGRVIRTTPEHPFWVREKGWTPAAHLEVGDLLSSHDGQWVPVEGLSRDDREVTTVYNLRVAEYHSYFVGCQQWGFSVWAHNAKYEIVLDAATGRYVLVDRTGARFIHPDTGKAITGKTAGDVESILRGKAPGELIPDISDIAIAPASISSSGLSIPSASELSGLGSLPDRGGLTNAGRSLSKHAAGKRAGSSAFPSPTGNPTKINNQAQQVLNDILNDPGKVVVTVHSAASSEGAGRPLRCATSASYK